MQNQFREEFGESVENSVASVYVGVIFQTITGYNLGVDGLFEYINVDPGRFHRVYSCT